MIFCWQKTGVPPTTLSRMSELRIPNFFRNPVGKAFKDASVGFIGFQI